MRSMGNGFWSVSKKRKKCKKFFVTVMGDVACHYIIKWLDSNHHDNQPAENPGSTIPRVFVCVRENTVFILPTGIIAYVIYKINLERLLKPVCGNISGISPPGIKTACIGIFNSTVKFFRVLFIKDSQPDFRIFPGYVVLS